MLGGNSIPFRNLIMESEHIKLYCGNKWLKNKGRCIFHSGCSVSHWARWALFLTAPQVPSLMAVSRFIREEELWRVCLGIALKRYCPEVTTKRAQTQEG